MSASNPLQLTRRNLLKLGGMVMVSSVAAAGLVAESTGTAPAVAGAFPIPPIDRVSSFIAIGADGSVTAYHGHVDLGTGIRTSLAQLVADELDVEFERITMVLGHTGRTPNQGPTIASNTIQVDAIPMRKAAAQVRQLLLGLAAEKLQQPVSALTTSKGAVVAKGGRRIGYGELAQGQDLNIALDKEVPLRTGGFNYIGKSVQRVDIPAKVLGALAYVHDVRVPGMLHGRVVRPPYAGADHGEFIGNTLEAVDESSIGHIPGIRAVVVIRDFVGIVAEREEHAEQALRELRVTWKPWPGMPDLGDVAQALRDNPSTQRLLVDEGDVDGAIAAAAQPMHRTYVWPYQMHASIGPSCAVADFRDGRLTVWAGTQNPHMLRTDLDRLVKLGEGNIDIVRLEAAGCYGRNCADDVCADAALLAIATGTPVRVQLTREQEHQWEPKGTGQLMDVAAAIDADGNLLAYDFGVRYPSNDAPLLALLLTDGVSGEPRTLEMGDRTAAPPYRYAHRRIVCHDMAPIMRASWLRGVSALPNSFAHDCMIDELAHTAGEDPVDYRIRHLDDRRAVDLIEATAARAGWRRQTSGSRGQPGADGLLHGRGVAYARYVHSKFPGFGAAWAAWVIDLRVHPDSGRIRIDRIVVGQDTGMVVNPDGVRHQIHGNINQTLSRCLLEKVDFNEAGVASREWGGYPIIGFKDLPPIDVLLMPRQDEPPMGAGESASVPGPAAIANALFDATGRRFYAAPFTPDAVRAVLNA